MYLHLLLRFLTCSHDVVLRRFSEMRDNRDDETRKCVCGEEVCAVRGSCPSVWEGGRLQLWPEACACEQKQWGIALWQTRMFGSADTRLSTQI